MNTWSCIWIFYWGQGSIYTAVYFIFVSSILSLTGYVHDSLISMVCTLKSVITKINKGQTNHQHIWKGMKQVCVGQTSTFRTALLKYVQNSEGMMKCSCLQNSSPRTSSDAFSTHTQTWYKNNSSLSSYWFIDARKLISFPRCFLQVNISNKGLQLLA